MCFNKYKINKTQNLDKYYLKIQFFNKVSTSLILESQWNSGPETPHSDPERTWQRNPFLVLKSIKLKRLFVNLRHVVSQTVSWPEHLSTHLARMGDTSDMMSFNVVLNVLVSRFLSTDTAHLQPPLGSPIFTRPHHRSDLLIKIFEIFGNGLIWKCNHTE